MSRDHSIKGERYYDCDLCGQTYRFSDTILNSAGLRVCPKDVDKGSYKFSVADPYDRSLPVFYDKYLDKYFQIVAESKLLIISAICHLGGFLPYKYIVPNFTTGKIYGVTIEKGVLNITEGDEGRRIPALIDDVSGQTLQLIVEDVSGTPTLKLLEIT